VPWTRLGAGQFATGNAASLRWPLEWKVTIKQELADFQVTELWASEKETSSTETYSGGSTKNRSTEGCAKPGTPIKRGEEKSKLEGFEEHSQPKEEKKKEMEEMEAAPPFNYYGVTVEKKGLDSRMAVRMLAKRFRISPTQISISGTKDKHALTRQRMCLKGVTSSLIASVSAELRASASSKVRLIGPPVFLKSPLQLGSHAGNRFKITVRCRMDRGKRPSERQMKCLKALLTSAIPRIQQQGFPNYFGPQRFGVVDRNTCDPADTVAKPWNVRAGLALLQARESSSQKVVSVLLEASDDQPYRLQKALKALCHSTRSIKRRAYLAMKLLPKEALLQQLLVRELVKESKKRKEQNQREWSENSCRCALKKVPYGEKIFLVQVYQSYVYNAALSKLLELRPERNLEPWDQIYDAKSGNARPTIPARSTVARKKMRTFQLGTSSMDEELAGNGFNRLVIPLPGYRTLGDEDTCRSRAGKIILDLIRRDGLSVANFQENIAGLQIKGAYRRMLAFPLNLDASLRAQLASATKRETKLRSRDSTGEISVTLRFDIGNSTYATSLLRELTRRDVCS